MVTSRVPVAVTVLAVLLATATPASAQLPAPPVVGAGPFQIGGYAALTLSHSERPEETERPEVSELIAAVMAWGQITPRASYLVELDMAKRTTETWTGRESDRWLVPVRMYLEYSANDLLRVRVGRFLTPVGQWNERHAEPLTWTPTRPLTTYRPFAKSVTGILVAGEGAVGRKDVGYALFWAPTGRLDKRIDDVEESSFVRAAGGRVAMEVRPGLTLGLSAAGMRRSHPREEYELEAPGYAGSDDWEEEEEEREEDADTRPLFGADLRWESARMEVSAEATWLGASDEGVSERGGFAMASVRLFGPFWAVGRGESYRLPDASNVEVGFAGLALRTSPRFVAKVGWQFSERPSARIPDGWFLSFSSLF